MNDCDIIEMALDSYRSLIVKGVRSNTKPIEDVLNLVSELLDSFRGHGFENNIVDRMVSDAWGELNVIKIKLKELERRENEIKA